MSKCPFWSTKKEKVSCSSDCPVNPVKNNNELCPFVEYAISEKVPFKEILEEDFSYGKDNTLEYILPAYVGYRD